MNQKTMLKPYPTVTKGYKIEKINRYMVLEIYALYSDRYPACVGWKRIAGGKKNIAALTRRLESENFVSLETLEAK